MRSWDHLSYGITKCYLPPDRGDNHAFTPGNITPGMLPVLFYRWKAELTYVTDAIML